MNVNYLRDGLELMSYSGYKLSYEEAALLENSLIILQNENKFRDIFFWGKIDGVEKDYYIAFGYVSDILRARKYFFSFNCIDWLQLPRNVKDPAQDHICLMVQDRFLGDPSYVMDVELDPCFSVDDPYCFEKQEAITKKIKEDERLVRIIDIITREAVIVPRGGLFEKLDRKYIFNTNFQGLTRQEATKLVNYQHFREPISCPDYNTMKQPYYNYATDRFDTVDDLIPVNNSYSLTLDRSDRGIVFMKSLHWPGMFFFHKTLSKFHGCVYLGDAKRNLDILFMI